MIHKPLLRIGALLCLGLASCNPSSTPDDEMTTPKPVGAAHRFEISIEEQLVRMRLAIHPHEQQRGLMQVKEMPEDEGMLFLYSESRQVSFWMRNTFIPLDIGYLDNSGQLVEVYPMFPHVEDPVMSISGNIRYALEMNQGWYARHKIKAGAKLDLQALAGAIKQRGLDAETYIDAE